jgi:hypothetical protein
VRFSVNRNADNALIQLNAAARIDSRSIFSIRRKAAVAISEGMVR